MHKLFTDGGSRGNPGNAAIAFLLFEEDKLLAFDSQFVGTATNNHAEYSALILALENASTMKIKSVECYLDSELVVKQLNGEYKVRDENIKKLFDQVVSLKSKFSDVKFIHVRREFNKFADKLVNIALDAFENKL